MFQRSLRRCRQTLKTFPDDIHLRRTLAVSSQELGDWYRLNNNRDAAEACFLQMKDEVTKTLATKPKRYQCPYRPLNSP